MTSMPYKLFMLLSSFVLISLVEAFQTLAAVDWLLLSKVTHFAAATNFAIDNARLLNFRDDDYDDNNLYTCASDFGGKGKGTLPAYPPLYTSS
jgi:hypothetical protein